MENAQEQNKKQQYDWLKGYQFIKGQSGNPGGRPKGAKSLKTFAREYLESLPDDEKIEYLKTLPTNEVWKMAEGNPKQDTDVTSGGEKVQFNLVHYGETSTNTLPVPSQEVSNELPASAGQRN